MLRVVLALLMLPLLASPLGCRGKDKPSAPAARARPAGPAVGVELRDSGLEATVVAGGPRDWRFDVPATGELGYALFTHDGKAFAVLHPAAGDVIRVDYAAGVVIHPAGRMDVLPGTTLVLARGTATY